MLLFDIFENFVIIQLCAICRAMKKPVGLLSVKVIKAIKLKKKDLLGGSDPYVKLTLSGDKVPGKKTVVKHSNLNPEWNEEFDLVVKEPESQELQLIVYDWEQVKHIYLLNLAFSVKPLEIIY